MRLKISNWTIFKARCPVCGQVVQACRDGILMAHNPDGEYIHPNKQTLCAGTDARGQGITEIEFHNRAQASV